MKKVDLDNIVDLSIDNSDNIYFTHKVRNEELKVIGKCDIKLEDESFATPVIFNILCYVLSCQNNTNIILLDEFGCSINQIILNELIKLFLENKLNTLIITTQSTSLMNFECIKKENILFVYKGINESSRIKGLDEISGVRENENFEKKYLEGNYGAIPHIRTITDD
jgi:predicted ATPase